MLAVSRENPSVIIEKVQNIAVHSAVSRLVFSLTVPKQVLAASIHVGVLKLQRKLVRVCCYIEGSDKREVEKIDKNGRWGWDVM